ncbi:hypothetical protein O3M35_006584 [Rhynocoris fuscipes]|uniref:Reverse transcriptase domain-containing protein n=1 Tax=Rhynocoris fuscipes TaxID=488301 RepID=A0AAW1DDY1_9HEMI
MLPRSLEQFNGFGFIPVGEPIVVTVAYELLKKENWTNALNIDKSIEVRFCNFLQVLEFYFNITFPICKQSNARTKSKKSWITKGIKISSLKLKQLYKRKLSGNESDKILYSKYKKIYSRVIKAAKRLDNDNFLRESSNKSKAMWNIIDKCIGKDKVSPHQPNNIEITVDGQVYSSPKTVADIFNKTFTTVNTGTDSNDAILNLDHPSVRGISSNVGTRNPYNSNNLFLNPVTEHELSKVITSLPNSKSTTAGICSVYILKQIMPYIVKPLLALINDSFVYGIFPDCLKTSYVIPVFKKGSKSDCNNYRPISILSNFSKIIEKLMFNRIYSFLDSYNILYENQHGFRANYSTHTAMLALFDLIYNDLNCSRRSLAIFIDLTKAFDSVPHQELLHKLEKKSVYVELHWIGVLVILEIDRK